MPNRRIPCRAPRLARSGLVASNVILLLVLLAVQQCMGDGSPASLKKLKGPRHTVEQPFRLYGFGIGKRTPPFFGLPEDAADHEVERTAAAGIDEEDSDNSETSAAAAAAAALFGKRDGSPSQQRRQGHMMYNFGLGKRERLYGPESDQGKRERNRYMFGIGKRGKKAELEDFMKRRYNFGLGKRSVYGGAEDDSAERWKRSVPSTALGH